jgi:branched-chain amino acid aminotransferase
MSAAPAKFAWLDGKFVRWEDAKIHIRSECVIRGIGVFEGLRGYWNEQQKQMFVFRSRDHFKRLEGSMRIIRLPLSYGTNVIEKAMLDLIKRCKLREDIHMRVNVYVGEGSDHTHDPAKMFVGSFVTALPRPAKKTIQTGTHAAVSSWRRIDDQAMPPRAKVTGNYVNSRLAQVQAGLDGYDTAIMLDQSGKVSETAGACVVIVRNGKVYTPSVTNSILEGITRDTVIQIFQQDLGLPVVERSIDRSELYMADEMFECGSGHEISPIVSIDRMKIGDGGPGPVTRAIQEKYLSVVRGKLKKYRRWLTPVY